jgi:hypothetical protein
VQAIEKVYQRRQAAGSPEQRKHDPRFRPVRQTDGSMARGNRVHAAVVEPVSAARRCR